MKIVFLFSVACAACCTRHSIKLFGSEIPFEIFESSSAEDAELIADDDPVIRSQSSHRRGKLGQRDKSIHRKVSRRYSARVWGRSNCSKKPTLADRRRTLAF